ncbi:MAG: DUF2273 domain-containing protein [Clostridiales bacterium]|jgi:uncharacterized membrane protein|nr:DUF2273 domain-containing protein [Clostridiales bacterium]
MENLTDFFKKYRWRIILIAVGILFSFLVFSLGFWRTILLTVVILVCYYFGANADKKGSIKKLFDYDSRD